jgi:two-component system response regulator VicR
MSTRPLRILVVDDDPAMVGAITALVGTEGHQVITAYDGLTAVKRFREERPDLVLLDLAMPGPDGFTVAGQIRAAGQAPILVVSGESGEAAKVRALGIGADDYLTKPFGVRELLARLKALLRRPRSTWRSATRVREHDVVSHLGVTLDPTRRRVTVDDRVVALTPNEFDLLYLLASHPGIVFERDEILARVWKDDVFVTARGVDALVKRLRRKIEVDPSQPTRVLTSWGTGYKFGES